MIILGIESSCDDTSVALAKATKDGLVVLSEKTASQIAVHKKYGGVVPEIAGRCHAENILPLIETVLDEAKIKKPDIISATAGPGLMTGLLVGVEATKTLSYLWNIPIVRINHIEGHILSVLVESKKYKVKSNIEFPALCLIVSGGHTELILMKDYGKYELVGKTQDDAAGECFDKVAKLIGFDYPGGPKISEYAKNGNPTTIDFPRPMLNSNNFNFSFSGLKTATLYWLQDNVKKQTPNSACPETKFFGELRTPNLNDFCASFEQAIVDVLVTKTLNAAKKINPKTIILAGGVSANQKLRQTLEKTIEQHSPVSSFQFPVSHCMDNAAMIAAAAYHHTKKKDFTPWQELEADPNWPVYEQL